MQPLEDEARSGRDMFLGRCCLIVGRLGMNGHDPRGFELGQVQSELVLHPSESSRCQTISTDVLRTHRRKLRDS